MSVIRFNDLGKQWQTIKAKAQPRLEKIYENSSYILGEDVSIFEANYSEYNNVTHTIGVACGLDALKLATLCFEEFADEGMRVRVFIPANTFIATILGVEDALRLMGADYEIELIDCDEYYQMDMDLLERYLEDRYTATFNHLLVVPVHLYGHTCDMARLYDLKEMYRFKILEDCSQAHGAEYAPGRKVGSSPQTDVSAFSLYPGKNLGAAGDAGVICTHHDAIKDKCLSLRNYGATVKYHHNDFGFNSRLDSIQAVVVDEKLKHLNAWNANRRAAATNYINGLQHIQDIITPEQAPYCHLHSYHLFVIRVPAAKRDALLKNLRENNVQAGIHYPIPIEQTLAYIDSHWLSPYTRENADQLLSLPIHPFITDEETTRVCQVISEFMEQ